MWLFLLVGSLIPSVSWHHFAFWHHSLFLPHMASTPGQTTSCTFVHGLLRGNRSQQFSFSTERNSAAPTQVGNRQVHYSLTGLGQLGLRPFPLFQHGLKSSFLVSLPKAISPSLLDTMPAEIPIREQFFHCMGAPEEVFLTDSWGSAPTLEMTPVKILDQFDTLPLPSKVGACTIYAQAIRANFQKINQDWILLSCQESEMSATQSHPYQLCTPAENFVELSSSPLGVRALAIIHWIITMSDGGEPQFLNPVTIVLGPFLNSPPANDEVGHNLSNVGLDFNMPAKPLGKSWPS